MKKVFSLFGTIALDGMSGVTKQLTGLDKGLKDISKVMAKTGRDLEKLGVSFSKTFTAPIVAAGTAVGMLTGKVGEYADKMLDLEQITGLSTDTLQEFEHVSKVTGGNFDALIGIVSKFTNKLPEIIKGGNASSEAFSKLGISLTDSTGNIRDMNDLLPEMFQSLKNIQNVNERNALAQDLFGRSLEEIAPLLGVTSEEFAKLRKEAHETGAVMSKGALEAADKYREMTARLKEQVGILGKELAINFIPIFRDTIYPLLVTSVIPAIKDLGLKVKGVFDWFNKLDPVVKENSIKFIAMLALVGPLLIGFGKITKAIAGLRATVLLLNSTLLANPYILVAAGVAALTLAIIKSRSETEKDTEAIIKNAEAMEYRKAKRAAWIKELKSNPDVKLPDFEKDFDKTWGAYVATATNSMEQIAITKQKYQEQEKGNDEKVLSTKRIKSEEEIKAAQEAADKIQKIEKDRFEQWEDLQDKRRDKDFTETEAIYENREKFKKEDQESSDKMLELQATQREKELKEDQDNIENMIDLRDKEIELRKRGEQEIYDLAVQFSFSLFDLFQSRTNNKMALVDEAYNREKENIEKSTLSRDEQQKKLDALDEKTAKKKRELIRKQAIQEKLGGIFSIGISTAMAIMDVWSKWAGVPVVAGILTALVAGIGIAQTAVGASKPIPAAEKGAYLPGSEEGTIIRAGEKRKPEVILPMETGARAMADAIVKKMVGSAERFSGSVAAMSRGAAGQASGKTVYENHLHVGDRYIDKSGLKSLWRDLTEVSAMENTRVLRTA